MWVLVQLAWLLLAGCASPPPPPPVPIEQNPYYQDLRRQLGIERAEQRQELCAKTPKPSIRMTSAQVFSSCWGKPDHAANPYGTRETRSMELYTEGYVYLSDGVVIKIITSR